MNYDNREELIRLKDVTVEFENKRVLSDVNLSVFRGDFLAITGPNGGGKTTLMRVMLKLLSPTSGEVNYYRNGEEVGRLKVGYLPQKSMIDTKFPITVRETIMSGLQRGFMGRVPKGSEEKFNEIVELCGVGGFLDKRIGVLSGGQLQRTLLGRAIISDPEIIFLDEPLSYVDKEFEHKIYSMMRDLSQRSTLVLVSHEMSEIGRMANSHILVDHEVVRCPHCHHLESVKS